MGRSVVAAPWKGLSILRSRTIRKKTWGKVQEMGIWGRRLTDLSHLSSGIVGNVTKARWKAMGYLVLTFTTCSIMRSSP